MNRRQTGVKPASFALKHSLKAGCAFAITITAFMAIDVAVARANGVSPHVGHDEVASPYVEISGLQSWIVENDEGQRRVVYTTQDGMTLNGPLYDGNGRDLSIALLGEPQVADVVDEDQFAGLPPLPELSTNAALSLPTAPSQTESAVTKAQTQARENSNPQANADEASRTDASDAVPTLPAAADASELLKQAANFSVWFSAGEPKPNAPVLYFMADPTCIHCAASTDRLAPLVEAGDVDLRIVLAPISSKEAIFQSASILQDPTPGSTFIAHLRAKIGSTQSPLDIRDPKDTDPDVVRALQRNVAWGRTNQVKGVPFWIYNGRSGPSIAAGRITNDVLQDVQPLPSEYAMETRQ